MTTMPGDAEAMSVLVICGAGASSTFVAMWLRHAAAERAVDLVASASSEDELDAAAPGVDVVLVGPHLADRFGEVAARARAAGATAALLPLAVIAERSGDQALDIALAAVATADTAVALPRHPSENRENHHG
jgi:Phosphotransferase system cellobiose-specific component IIB